MTEAELQTAVIDTARLFGWRVAHFRPAQTKHGWRTPVAADGKGFPDLVLMHPARGLIFAELKAGRNNLSAEQEQWIEGLNTVAAIAGPHMRVCVWTPEHWDSGQIISTLTGRPADMKGAA